MARRFAVAVALAAGACFSDAPPLADGSTTGDGPCAVGSEGCFCTEGNACDDGLECLLPAGVCVAEGCTLGAGLCGCDQGGCVDGYKCVENFCAPENSATISDTGSADENASADATMSSSLDGTTTGGPTTLDTGGISSADAATDGTLVMDGTITDATVTDTVTDATAESSTTTGEPQTCAECIMMAQLGDCSLEWDVCDGCDPWVECFSNQLGGCCDDAQPPMSWTFFSACVDMSCTVLCGSVQCGAI